MRGKLGGLESSERRRKSSRKQIERFANHREKSAWLVGFKERCYSNLRYSGDRSGDGARVQAPRFNSDPFRDCPSEVRVLGHGLTHDLRLHRTMTKQQPQLCHDI